MVVFLAAVGMLYRREKKRLKDSLAENRRLRIEAEEFRRREALEGRQAPDFELPDLDGVDHRLTEWDGRRRLLVAFATW